MLAQRSRAVFDAYCSGEAPLEQLAEGCDVTGFDWDGRKALTHNLRQCFYKETVAEISKRTTIDLRRLGDLSVALGEGITNALRYAGPDRFGREFVSLVAIMYSDRAYVVISNSTNRSEWEAQDQISHLVAGQAESGYGCLIMNLLLYESFGHNPIWRIVPHERIDLVCTLDYNLPN